MHRFLKSSTESQNHQCETCCTFFSLIQNGSLRLPPGVRLALHYPIKSTPDLYLSSDRTPNICSHWIESEIRPLSLALQQTTHPPVLIKCYVCSPFVNCFLLFLASVFFFFKVKQNSCSVVTSFKLVCACLCAYAKSCLCRLLNTAVHLSSIYIFQQLGLKSLWKVYSSHITEIAHRTADGVRSNSNDIMATQDDTWRRDYRSTAQQRKFVLFCWWISHKEKVVAAGVCC